MKKLVFILSILVAGISFSGCLKKSFEAPPDKSDYDPGLPANAQVLNIQDLLKMKKYTSSSNLDTLLITQDYALTVVVNADDRSGNLYKSIYVQDNTGGLQVYIDGYSLYNRYPVGRKLYIKLKGLYLSYNSGTGTPCLSISISEQGAPVGLSGSDADGHIVKANTGNVVKDTVISFNVARANTPANSPLLGRLVTIADSVQFGDTLRTYASVTDPTNRYIWTCGSDLSAGNTTPAGMMAVRTDNYANFAAIKLPYGKGKIQGIFTTYKSTPQLILRDTSDVKFYGPRCGAVAPPAPTAVISIDSLRKLFSGTGTFTLPPVLVKGVVISDMSKGNVASGNFILEDGSRKSIILYMGSSGSYSLGDSLVIDATGGKLSLYSGALELTNVTTSKITKAASGKTVIPVTLTIAQLNASFAQYENVLVKVLNASITGGTTYGGNRTLSDGTGTISLYTATGATFSAANVPTTPKTIVGIATPFTPNEIKLRDPSIDVY